MTNPVTDPSQSDRVTAHDRCKPTNRARTRCSPVPWRTSRAASRLPCRARLWDLRQPWWKPRHRRQPDVAASNFSSAAVGTTALAPQSPAVGNHSSAVAAVGLSFTTWAPVTPRIDSQDDDAALDPAAVAGAMVQNEEDWSIATNASAATYWPWPL